METLADYGTVAYFAVNTFTTGIYRAWFSLGDRVAAAQLAAMLLAFVLFLLTVERISRGRPAIQHHRPQPPMAGLVAAAGAGWPSWPVCCRCCSASSCRHGLLLKMALTEG